ncbi:sulfite exporter TauE/SafE family protein [Rhizobium sp. L1K21]|uniref:sulfite exporter TauE/SafE family protein n=1 Tax=Rhizobium sp. L1K21 TaxID=2954933 RepID=UPI0020925E53|nr:sulfite exporter TauE/SafE family protein [Rhizobium sp. L1K21]MCO6186069.1 sulfite exporter TauE/SafE family protein [Rhizobium sp. L1K21]
MGFLSQIEPLYTLAGAFVGILIGLTGVGGGSLMTPILVLLFGVHPAAAVGTDLLFAAVTKVAGTAIHGMNKTINWRIVANLAAGSIPAAALTIWILAGVDRRSATVSEQLNLILGGVLVLTASVLFLRTKLMQIAARYRGAHPELTPAKISIMTLVLGAVIGALVSLTSVGAGAIGVTVLLLLYPHLNVRDMVGTDIVHAVPLTLLAGFGYWMLGETQMGLLGSLLLGSLPGVVFGSYLAPRLPENVIRPMLATTLAAVGLKMLLS